MENTNLTQEDLKAMPLNRLTQEQCDEMDQLVSSDKIKEAFFNINSKKSPDPNGHNGFFFKEYWGIIGEEIFSTIKYVFEEKKREEALNASLLCLILKIHNHILVTDLRPIA